METKFVWRKEKANVYVAKVICTCESNHGEFENGTQDKFCISCGRVIPKSTDEISTFISSNPVINSDNEIEISFPDYPSKADVVKELIKKYEDATYCKCEVPVEQASMFGVQPVCIRCDKTIKK